MSRKILIEQSQFPYHVTARCINREWFSIPMGEVWEIMVEQAFFLQQAFGFRIHAFVLMSNHFHMLLSTPEANLSVGMCSFMKETGRQINYESDRINQVWGGRFFRSMMTNYHYYLHAYKYVYQNPVQSNLCTDVLSYQYTTLRGLLGFERQIISIDDNTLFDMGVENCLEWLNKNPNEDHWRAVERGLKKTIFQLARCEKTKKELVIEHDLL